MTIQAFSDDWDLSRVQQVVAQNELERSRVEYKRELGNGNKALEAIAALANTFGGVVLIGEDAAFTDPLQAHAADRMRSW